MSVLDNPRVTSRPGGRFAVAGPNGDVVVLDTGVAGWAICTGPDLDFVPVATGGFATGFPTVEAAIEAALQ